MKKNYLFTPVRHIAGIGFVCMSLLISAGCDKSKEAPEVKTELSTNPPPAIVSDDTGTKEAFSAESLGAKIAQKAMMAKSNDDVKYAKGAKTYIHFGDPASCTYNPNICDNTFVLWPGYIQNTGYGEWGYAWMSNGPGSGFISYGTGDHYHIMGFLFPDLEPNHKHSAMFGSDWFAFYMQRSGVGRINFNLTQIKVKGTVPITLWFKASNNSWWYWPSIGPGWWNLPGANNIKELHIRAASGSSTDKYSIDDIQVKGL